MANLLKTILFVLILNLIQTVTAYDTIFMGHATSRQGYNYVCHNRIIPNTIGGIIDGRKEYYEGPLKDCEILISSPIGYIIDFRFTEMSIIASSTQTCEDASLDIYDGSSKNATSILHRAFPNGICGRSIPKFHIRSRSNQMLVVFRATSAYTSKFSAIYTGYSPRTSVFCFYCGDLCLRPSQICDNLYNCRGQEDEMNCDEDDSTKPSNNPLDIKETLLLVMGGVLIIVLSVMVIVVLRIKIKQTFAKRRRRRAHMRGVMHPPPPHLMNAQRTASGNSRTAVGRPGYYGIRPYMAGPTNMLNPIQLAPRPLQRSDMPPPYSAAAESGYQETEFTSDNPGYIPDEVLPHISDDDEEKDTSAFATPYTIDTSHATVISQGASSSVDQQAPISASLGEVKHDTEKKSRSNSVDQSQVPISAVTHDTEEHPTQQALHEGPSAAADTELSVVVTPETVIDNYAVDVSARDTIHAIDNLIVDDVTTDSGGDNDEVIYI